VRDGYLGWLAGHEAGGAVFVESEPWKEQPLGDLRLIGRSTASTAPPTARPS
jgi:ATP-dependent helicase/nuclease subunit B